LTDRLPRDVTERDVERVLVGLAGPALRDPYSRSIMTGRLWPAQANSVGEPLPPASGFAHPRAASKRKIDGEMSEGESWSELRDRRMKSPAAGAACEVGRMPREAQGLSQRQLADQMGTTQSVVGRREAGGSRPTIATGEQ
jgi:hypothetical protein